MLQELSALVQAGSAVVVAVIAIRTASRPHVQQRRVAVVKRERPQ